MVLAGRYQRDVAQQHGLVVSLGLVEHPAEHRLRVRPVAGEPFGMGERHSRGGLAQPFAVGVVARRRNQGADRALNLRSARLAPRLAVLARLAVDDAEGTIFTQVHAPNSPAWIRCSNASSSSRFWRSRPMDAVAQCLPSAK